MAKGVSTNYLFLCRSYGHERIGLVPRKGRRKTRIVEATAPRSLWWPQAEDVDCKGDRPSPWWWWWAHHLALHLSLSLLHPSLAQAPLLARHLLPSSLLRLLFFLLLLLIIPFYLSLCLSPFLIS